MYNSEDYVRYLKEPPKKKVPYRTSFRRDYARIIHSPEFRRLKGKTQLFPGNESDFFRNRLTHSIEVAQIGKSIAIRLNYLLAKKNQKFEIDTDLIECACLAHDIGHAPFGHLGEHELDVKMKDFGGFEGNAQTLRILSVLSKRIKVDADEASSSQFTSIDKKGNDLRRGLNLTARTLSSVIKYDHLIPKKYIDRAEVKDGKKNIEIGPDAVKRKSPTKGYYFTEEELVKWIKTTLKIPTSKKLYTIECSIMDIADDIAYSTYDLEDSLKGGFISILDLFSTPPSIINKIKNDINTNFKLKLGADDIEDVIIDAFKDCAVGFEFDEKIDKLGTIATSYISGVNNRVSKGYAENGYLRTNMTSSLVGEFIESVNISFDKKNPILSTVKVNKKIRLKIEVLKRLTYELQIQSPRLKIIEHRGKEIVGTLFDMIEKSKGAYLPNDFKVIYDDLQKDSKDKEFYQKRTICDFIAGMTDNYALEFYSRLKSEKPRSIFKPI